MKKAIILAAGIGSRLRPITERKPKCLVEVGGKPMLGYSIDALIAHGIEDIVIVTGYLSDSVQRYCAETYPGRSFTFVDNSDFDTTNNLYSLYLTRKHLTGDTLVMNGDLVFDASVIAKLKAVRTSAVAVDVGRYMEESMKVVVKGGFVTSISKKIPPHLAYGCSIDVYKFVKKDVKELVRELESTIKRGSLNEWTEAALDRLFSKGAIQAKPVAIGRARWAEIDNLDDLHAAEALFNPLRGQIARKKIFFIDNDGTLAIQDGGTLRVLPEARDFLKSLARTKKHFYICTNNSSFTPTDIVSKFKAQGITIPEKHVLISTRSAMEHLKAEGVKRLYSMANRKTSLWLKKSGFIFERTKPQALLLCYDTELTYAKLSEFIQLVRAGVPYYATHIDKVCPTEHGPIPDIGLFIDMIEATTGKRPLQTFGKPDTNFILPILRAHKLKPKDAVVVGDRLYTDMVLAKKSGALSVLALSGETKRPDYEFSDIRADVLVRDVGELRDILNDKAAA
ncbi:hypothetical protein A2704_04550 [Candidatus Kaiserbacteria bacterium RIFCSPHIGHO2_01_FULL_54_36b]|uniref:Nucleotidyl transferase domain-containing protein n=1 Tax=Candidatus Kaiserbacteria bacterium RIFCSPHIGHO2_01_FULL_54_36b TaxID=1798483 RepID=A0A1F6CR35_9BACT|nr:MAG: hypothetical protein A2704_04550 [Candidatus Kaiserbacteria bacterium RIFCSPHIGHO2_01_FULL_54_36b]